MRWFVRLAVLVTVAVASNAASLPHEAYIWQRQWTPQVRAAIREQSKLFQGWRVLAAETDRKGRLPRFAVGWKSLRGKTVTGVVRIDGTLRHLDTKTLVRDVRAAMAVWPRGTALEIDYDCGTASLGAYAVFLKDVRALRPSRLSITALPAWLGSSDLKRVLAEVDEAVLQVHAVRAPSKGLFDATLARRWIDQMDAAAKPFRIALPDYGTRIIRSQGGSVIALESEAPKLIGGASAEELIATPEAVAGLLAGLQHRPPRHLTGIVWFRLPVQGDRRIWSPTTLAAVIQAKPLTGHIAIDLRPGPVPGSKDILLINESSTDTAAPRAIMLPDTCRLADGIGPYRYDRQKKVLVRLQNVLIPAHHVRVVGWVHCGAGRGEFHVEK